MKSSFNKRDISILIGNALDHFDTAIYGFLAPLLAKIFFPNHDKIVGLILTYSVLATSLFTRPIGSYFFGIIAKKYGGVFALSHSLIGVALTTALIGLIPSHAQIGWLAPLLLVIIRTLQGIYSEGECAIAKLYILENKEQRKALKASYLYQTSTMVGIIFASFISTIILDIDYNKYWRVCFIFGGLTALIGYFLRKSDSIICHSHIPLCHPREDGNPENNSHPEFISGSINKMLKQVQHDKKNYWIPAFAGMTVLHDLITIWNNKLNILRVSLTVGFSYLTYILPFVFMNSFIPLITNISLETMMAFNTALLIFDMVMISIIGRLVEKLPYIKILGYTLSIMVLTIIPLWLFLNNASLWYVNFVRIWIIILGITFLCPLNCWLNDLFKTPDKYMLVGIGSSIGSSLIGRLTPSICLGLWHVTNSSLSIGIYITVAALGALWAIKTSD
ncbi:MFS transporter [Rickettsia endosymbiont of Halotydeus destructor]|uniref:MFS transporter n=1 Tax=Rickettsia endosymbiont of Halotydeus destructor TaxID=2996754 RepID=UPI003BAED68D